MHILGIGSFSFFGHPHTLVGKVVVLSLSYILILFTYISWWTSIHQKYEEVWAWYLGETFESGKDTNRLPRRLSSKESAHNSGEAEDSGFIPGSGRSPRGRHGNPLQYSCSENPMDRGTWWATIHGVAKSRMWLKRLAPHSPKSLTAIWDLVFSIQSICRTHFIFSQIMFASCISFLSSIFCFSLPEGPTLVLLGRKKWWKS